jgi:hypothetical protein
MMGPATMLTTNTPRSDKQIEASRANGAKSRGPVTDEGKQHSSRNAIPASTDVSARPGLSQPYPRDGPTPRSALGQHGLLAQTVVLDGESKERFATLLHSIQEELQPATAIENQLVETMAVARWRQFRIVGMEKAAVAREVGKLDPAHGPAANTTQAYRALNGDSRFLETMNRYETRFDRQYGRAFKAFKEYRVSQRQKKDSSADEPEKS